MRNCSEQEFATLREWDFIQHALLSYALLAPSALVSRRSSFAECITRSTRSHARICWGNDSRSKGNGVRLYKIQYQRMYYGDLELTPEYLISKLLPDIRQRFAHLCALILALTEYETFMDYQKDRHAQSLTSRQIKPLSGREIDVLYGLVHGESESEMASRLKIEPPTVHTHLQRLYTHFRCA